MGKYILIKEIIKNKFISEFLIYYVVGSSKVEAYLEFSDEDVKYRVTELAVKYFEEEEFKPSIKKITYKLK